MKNIRLFLAIIFFLSNYTMKSQSVEKINRIQKSKTIILSSSLALSMAGAYYYAENAWWNEEAVDFHFDQGADLTYALNVDKAGHFMGGIIVADIFQNSILWVGLDQKTAYWYAALYGSGIQLAIEIKDAYAPYWGFSKADFVAGSVGSFWPLLTYYYPKLKAVNFKLSYWKRSDIYWQLEAEREKFPSSFAWQDDYPNQTYWMSIDVNSLIGESWWPDFLNLAIGFGLDDSQYLDSQNTKKGGNNEWYIAIDYDLSKVLKKYDGRHAKKIKKWLNYLKLPAPTIRIAPTMEFYPFFM